MATCLFTHEPLDEGTKIEHTLLRSLGGRIESRCVSSDSFNNRCSTLVDEPLRKAYGVLTNLLGPLMPTQSRSGFFDVQVDGEPSGLVVDSVGRVQRSGIAITARDPKNLFEKLSSVL